MTGDILHAALQRALALARYQAEAEALAAADDNRPDSD